MNRSGATLPLAAVGAANPVDEWMTRTPQDDLRDAAREPDAGWYAWLCIGILLLLTFSSNIDRNIIAMLVEPIKKELRLDDFQFSLLHGFAFATFYALASLPMGWAADRFSRRWILFLGASFWSLSTFACGFARSFVQLAIARFGVGAGEAALNPAAYSVVNDLFPKRRLTLALATLATGAAIAAGLGAAGGGYIIAWAQHRGGFMGFSPWHLVFWVIGLPGLLIAPLVFLIPRPQPRVPVHVGTRRDAGFVQWIRQNRLYFACLSFGVGAHTAMGSAGIWTPAFLARTQHLDIKQIGLLVGLITGVPTTVGYLGGGWLVDRMVTKGVKDAHLRFLVVNTALAGLVGTVAYGFVHNLPLLVGLLAINNMLLPCAGPAIAHLQLSAPPSSKARAMALFLTIMNLTGPILGPSGAALFSQFYGGERYIGLGVASVYLIGSAIGLLCFVLAIVPARTALRRAG